MRCVMRYAWTPKFQLSGPTVHSYTVAGPLLSLGPQFAQSEPLVVTPLPSSIKLYIKIHKTSGGPCACTPSKRVMLLGTVDDQLHTRLLQYVFGLKCWAWGKHHSSDGSTMNLWELQTIEVPPSVYGI